jgi:gliding motility-associated lipoprotein GldD
MTILLFTACQDDNQTPKPTGYPRMTFPPKEYKEIDKALPYTFEIPTYAKIEKDKGPNAEPYWINVQFPKLNATLHVSYKEVDGNLQTYTEDSRTMVYKHSGKADNIVPKQWVNHEDNVYGILYQIKGNAASTLQFHLTDSVRHLVRASFYFNTEPNKDSLAPAQKFIRKDIDRMIESFRWNEDFRKN